MNLLLNIVTNMSILLRICYIELVFCGKKDLALRNSQQLLKTNCP